MLNEATPVVQLTERTAPENDAVQLAGTAPAMKVTEPANPLIAVTVTVEVPATVARVVTAGADNEKSWTVTLTLVVRDNVLGAVPVVPATRTLNAATPVVQLTDRTAIEKLAAQPLGTVPAVKITVPLKPLMGAIVTVEVPATVAKAVMAGAEREKSTTWNNIGLVVWDSEPPVPVTVTA
jgi:hypothetical protein